MEGKQVSPQQQNSSHTENMLYGLLRPLLRKRITAVK